MDTSNFARLIWCAAVLAFALLMVPTIIFLLTGWKIRRDKLIAYLSPDALALYYTQFPWTASDEKDLKVRFTQQFNYLYGARHFVVPLVVFFGFNVVTAWVCARSMQARFVVAPHDLRLPSVYLYSLAGGFIWIISDQLGRLSRRDLSPRDVYAWVFRLLLAIPFGVSIGFIANPTLGRPLALFLGAFPTQTLFTIARRIATKNLDLGDQQSSDKGELSMLQSISREKAEAFQDQGIDTVAALAWVDPVDLTIRTNFDFNYVLDCMSQALLWVYFQDKTKALFPYSIRGSQDVFTLIRILNGQVAESGPDSGVVFDQGRAMEALQSMAGVVGISTSALRTTFDQIAGDPYTQFIAKVWH